MIIQEDCKVFALVAFPESKSATCIQDTFRITPIHGLLEAHITHISQSKTLLTVYFTAKYVHCFSIQRMGAWGSVRCQLQILRISRGFARCMCDYSQMHALTYTHLHTHTHTHTPCWCAFWVQSIRGSGYKIAGKKWGGGRRRDGLGPLADQDIK